jgi:hypothetical protein
MKRLDSITFQNRPGKMLEILCNNHFRITTNCSGKNMTIIFIRQAERRNERHVPCHQAVSHMPIHQFTGAFQSVRIDIGTLGPEVPNPFIMDFGGPPGPEQISYSLLHEKVAERGWIKNTGIKDGCQIREHQ